MLQLRPFVYHIKRMFLGFFFFGCCVCGLALKLKLLSMQRIQECPHVEMMPWETEARAVPISSAEHSLIYLFIYLRSSGGRWRVAEPAGRATGGDGGLRVDAGRRSHQRWDLGAGRLRGSPARLGSGRSNRGRRKMLAFDYGAPEHANA